jgi:hypothetical protein
VYKTSDVKVEQGDCFLTLFGLKAPKGGIDSENQVKAVPAVAITSPSMEATEAPRLVLVATAPFLGHPDQTCYSRLVAAISVIAA